MQVIAKLQVEDREEADGGNGREEEEGKDDVDDHEGGVFNDHLKG